MNQDAIKKKLGIAAAEHIQDHQVVGLGTGTTAFFFIEHLIKRCQEGLQIQAAASSQASQTLAKEGGIPLLDINTLTHIDITVDGADEIDPKNRMIKGGGGALVREKIIASMSQEMVIIVDETKLCKALGKHPLPIEVIPFATKGTQTQIEKLGFTGTYRTKPDGALYITDNHNYIFDIHFSDLRETPEHDHSLLLQLPGVVETGYFFNFATAVFIGNSDGTITRR